MLLQRLRIKISISCGYFEIPSREKRPPKKAKRELTDKDKQQQHQTADQINRISPWEPPTEETTCPADEAQQNYTLNFDNVSILEYIRFLSKVTNTNFIFENDDLNFNVTVVAEEPTSIDDIRSALLQILRANNLELLEQGNNILIHKNPELGGVAKVIAEELHNVCDGTEALVTRVFRLKNVNPVRVASIISPMVSKGALVEVSPETHHLVVTDVTSNVNQIADLLKSLDNPNAAFEVASFHPEHTYIDAILPIATEILKPMMGGQALLLVPQTTTDTLYIVSSPGLVERALEVLKMLDVGERSPWQLPDGHLEKTHFYVYKLQSHKGDQIKEALGQMAVI